MESTSNRLGLVVLALALWADPATAQTLTRGPYLNNVTENSVVIRFELDVPAAVEVHYGPDDSYGNVYSAGTGPSFIVGLGGLSAGQEYHYSLVSGTVTLEPDHSFTTTPPARAPFRLLVLGDTRSNHVDHAEVIAATLDENAQVLVHTGDLVSSGEVFEDWVHFFDIEKPLISEVPIFPVIGNHEEESGHVELMLEYFTNPITTPAPEHYYSVDYGNVHMVVLDGHVNVDPEWVCLTSIGWWESCFNDVQLAWLDADLDEARADPDIDHIFVFNHMGPYSSKDGRQGMKHMRDLMEMFQRYDVAFVISGHDHYYERGFSGNDIPYIVTAGGGAPLYDLAEPSLAPHTVIYNESSLHYTLFDFDYLDVIMTVYRIDGTILDTYGFSGNPRLCVSAFDCGTLPPECSLGEWECVASHCQYTSCDGPVDPVPDEWLADEHDPEPVAEIPDEYLPEPTPDTVDVSTDTHVPPDAGVDDPETGDVESKGCGCSLVG